MSEILPPNNLTPEEIAEWRANKSNNWIGSLEGAIRRSPKLTSFVSLLIGAATLWVMQWMGGPKPEPAPKPEPPAQVKPFLDPALKEIGK